MYKFAKVSKINVMQKLHGTCIWEVWLIVSVEEKNLMKTGLTSFFVFLCEVWYNSVECLKKDHCRNPNLLPSLHQQVEYLQVWREEFHVTIM